MHEKKKKSKARYEMVLQETRPICADREARNVATKHNFNMQTCGCQEKSR